MYATDARVTFKVDGQTVGEGSFLTGVDLCLDVPPGTHVLDATLSVGFIKRQKTWSLSVPAADVGAVFDVAVGYNRFWGTFERALATRIVGEGEIAALAPVEAPAARPGVGKATALVLAVLLVCFIAELAWPISGAGQATPSIDTLLGMGGLDVESAHLGQWFRLLSCTFLHGDPLHLAFNALAIFFGGMLVERAVGARWFLVLYLLGGMAGSVVSLRMNPGDMVSVGASGSALALFGGGLFIAQTLPRHLRGPTTFQLMRVLVPSLIPVAMHDGMRVDIGAHIGGALAGFAIGGLFFLGIRGGEENGRAERFRRSPLAWLFLAPLAGALVWTAHCVVSVAHPSARDFAAIMASLAPNEEVMKTATPTPEVVAAWARKYPDDPRVISFEIDEARAQEDWLRVDQLIAHGREVLPRVRKAFPNATLSDLFDNAEKDVAIRRRLLPNKELPRGTPAELDAAWSAHGREWVARYPDDPRVRANVAWEESSSDAEAEEHVRIGLERIQTFDSILTELDSVRERLLLRKVYLLRARGQRDEAKTVLATLCVGKSPSADFARNNHMCPPP